MNLSLVTVSFWSTNALNNFSSHLWIFITVFLFWELPEHAHVKKIKNKNLIFVLRIWCTRFRWSWDYVLQWIGTCFFFGFNDPSVRTYKDNAPISPWPSPFCPFFVLLLNNLSHFNFHRTKVSTESSQITLIVILPSHSLTNLFFVLPRTFLVFIRVKDVDKLLGTRVEDIFPLLRR